MPVGGLHSGLHSGATRPYTPQMIVSGGGTSPAFGTSGGIAGRYGIVGDMCFGIISVLWLGTGTSQGSGSGYMFSLPVPGLPASAMPVSDYSVGTAYVLGNALGGGGAGFGTLYMTNDTAGPRGSWISCNLLSVAATVTGTILSGQTSATVTHPFAIAPPRVIPVPRGDPNALGGYWISAINATTTVVNCHTAPGSNFNFDISCFFGLVAYGPNSPWATGGALDHVDIFFQYPIGSRNGNRLH